jgi:rhodanese-related sulfurtransferase
MILPKDYFEAKLAYEVDIQDAAQGLSHKEFILVDTRRKESWDHGHVLGSVHIPAEKLTENLAEYLPKGSKVVVYGWGPGCNGATKAASLLAAQGYSVREMLGGFEYWCRSGLPVESATGSNLSKPDPLVIASGIGTRD